MSEPAPSTPSSPLAEPTEVYAPPRARRRRSRALSAPVKETRPPAPGPPSRLIRAAYAAERHMDALVAVLLASGAATILLHAIAYNKRSDMPDHATMAATSVQQGVPFAHPLFFWLVALLAGWSSDSGRILVVIPYVLGVAFAVSVALSIHLVRERAGSAQLEALYARSPALRWGLLASVVAVFYSFSLPTTTIYIGQFPPMVWHNSTIIFMTPLAIGLFILSLRFVRAPSLSAAAWVALLVTLGVAAKPSFVMAWIPALPAFALLARRAWRPVIGALALSLYGLALVGLQSLYLFASQDAKHLYHVATQRVGYDIGTGGVVFAPFKVWLLYVPLPWASVLASSLLTIAGLEVYRGRLVRSSAFQFAALLYVAGLAIFALLALTGPSFYYGDLIWQMMPITLIIFLTVIAEAWRTIAERGRPAMSDGIVFLALAIQVGAFFHYINHYWTSGGFI